jgi:hypothetical protein
VIRFAAAWHVRQRREPNRVANDDILARYLFLCSHSFSFSIGSKIGAPVPSRLMRRLLLPARSARILAQIRRRMTRATVLPSHALPNCAAAGQDVAADRSQPGRNRRSIFSSTIAKTNDPIPIPATSPRKGQMLECDVISFPVKQIWRVAMYDVGKIPLLIRLAVRIWPAGTFQEKLA